MMKGGLCARLWSRRAEIARWFWLRRWTLVFNAFLLSPISLYEIQLGDGLHAHVDKIVLFALPASILWLTLVQVLIPRQRLAHVLLFPFYVLAATDIWLIQHYDTRLTSSMLLVIVENLADAGGFVRTNAGAMALASVLTLLWWSLAVYKLRGVRLDPPRWLAPACVAGLVLMYGGLSLKSRGKDTTLTKGWLDTLSHDRGSPFGIFPQGYTAWLLHRDQQDEQQRCAAFTFHARQAQEIEGREVFVLVIGESSRPDHWGLYGYPRDTNPRLSKDPGVLVFQDVLSQAALTNMAVPLLITRSEVATLATAAPEKSILSAYREAGFTTMWLSTQQRDQWTGRLNRFPVEANTQRFFERRPDGKLVEVLSAMLDAEPAKKIFVVLHTNGSHFVFSERYPSEFRVFAEATPGADPRADMIDEYDNSIRYTDHVLGELIELLRRQDGLTALLYVGDHGENLMDDDRKLLGHFLNNEYDLPVPMVMWTSDRYRARFPAKLDAAAQNASRKLSSTVVFPTLADLGELVLDGEEPRHSILREPFEETPRMVVHGRGFADFEQTPLAERLRALNEQRASAGGSPGRLSGGPEGRMSGGAAGQL